MRNITGVYNLFNFVEIPERNSRQALMHAAIDLDPCLEKLCQADL